MPHPARRPTPRPNRDAGMRSLVTQHHPKGGRLALNVISRSEPATLPSRDESKPTRKALPPTSPPPSRCGWREAAAMLHAARSTTSMPLTVKFPLLRLSHTHTAAPPSRHLAFFLFWCF